MDGLCGFPDYFAVIAGTMAPTASWENSTGSELRIQTRSCPEFYPANEPAETRCAYISLSGRSRI